MQIELDPISLRMPPFAADANTRDIAMCVIRPTELVRVSTLQHRLRQAYAGAQTGMCQENIKDIVIGHVTCASNRITGRIYRYDVHSDQTTGPANTMHLDDIMLHAT